jgi:hypothetical protein
MSEKDELLGRVGEHVREEQAEDARFERVACGRASDAELAELEREASTDPELATRLEASRPLDGVSVERIASRLMRSDMRSRAPANPAQDRLPRTWMRRAGVVVAPLALAASVFLYLTARERDTVLPTYDVTATSDRSVRGPDAASTRLRISKDATPDSRYAVLLRPASASTAKIVAYVFAVRPESEPTLIDAALVISEQGAVRIEGATLSLRGASELRVIVGSASALGGAADAAIRAKSGGSDARVRVVVVPIDPE